MLRTLERVLSQDDARRYLAEGGHTDERFVKYVYDGYTQRGGYRAIRKPKMRKRIKLEFHWGNFNKEQAQEAVNELLAIDKWRKEGM